MQLGGRHDHRHEPMLRWYYEVERKHASVGSNMGEQREQRKHRRAPSSERIDIVLDDHSSFASEHIMNISEGGLFITTSSPWSPGTTFSLGMRPFKDRAPIRGTAQVVWVRATEGSSGRPMGMGARFLELEEGSVETIGHLLDEDHEPDDGFKSESDDEMPPLDLFPAGVYDDDDDGEEYSMDAASKRSNLISQLVLAVAALIVIVLALSLWFGGDKEGPALIDSTPAGDEVPEQIVAESEPLAVSEETATPVQDEAVMVGGELFSADADPVAAPEAEIPIGATRITNISWAREADFDSLTIRGDQDFTPEQISLTTLSLPPRCLIRIAGIEEPFYRQQIPTTLKSVTGVRLGHHHEMDPPEMHVVFDLSDSMVSPQQPIIDGNSVTIRLK